MPGNFRRFNPFNNGPALHVPGHGPVPADCLLIGEKPGQEEAHFRCRCDIWPDVHGKPFIGPAGRTLDNFLYAANVNRDSLFVTNCVHEFTDYSKPTRTELRRDKPALMAEIEACNPKVIGLVGAYAVEWVLGKEKSDLHRTHGVPLLVPSLFNGELKRKGGWLVLPMFHPAGVIHAPETAPSVFDDFLNLGKLLDGEITVKVNPITKPEYRCLRLPGELLQIVDGHRQVAIDTEVGHDGSTWSIQFSCAPGSGFMIRCDGSARAQSLLAAFIDWLRRERPTVILHNTLFDLSKLRQVGIDLIEFDIPFVDTMVWAYQSCTEPQSLKSLAYRHCALDMVEYDEVIGDVGYDIALDYLYKAVEHEWPKPEQILEYGGSGARYRQPQNVGKTVARILADIASEKKNKNDEPVDPRKRWNQIERSVKRPVVMKLGPMRIPDLGDIPFEQAEEYACLAGTSLVMTSDGWMKIRDIVKKRYSGEVYGSADGRITSGRCTGWYAIRHKSRIDWLSVTTKHTVEGRWGHMRTRYTPDHKLLTISGFKRVDEITAADEIILPYEKLNSVEYQVVIGSVLGDGTLKRRHVGGWASLEFSHCEKQWPYLKWKRELLDGVGCRLSVIQPVKQGFIAGKAYTSTRFQSAGTLVHPEILDIYRNTYRKNISRKHIGDWAEDLDWLGLAIWFQDDGTYVTDSMARLYVCDLSVEEVDRLREILKRKFRVETSRSPMHERPHQWMIHILKDGTNAFYQGISRFVHPAMRYKLPSWMRNFAFDKKGGTNLPRGMCSSPVVSVDKNPVSRGRRGDVKTCYCVDVEGVHNFLTPWEVAHNCRDSDATFRIAPILEEKIKALEMTATSRIDHDVLPMLDSMQSAGIKLAPREFWDKIEDRCYRQMDQAKHEIFKLTGREINPGSGDQVADLLYGPTTEGGLGLIPPMLTDGGKTGKRRGSTNDKCLENLLAVTPVTQHVMDYREADKVRGTYVDKLRQRLLDGYDRAHMTIGVPGEELPENEGDDPTYQWDRVRGTIRATRVPTGRLAIANPNLMAIPIRSDLGRQVRFGFVASDGWIMYDADLSQIEMRMFAHMCADPKMIRIFELDQDIHKMTAAEMFSVSVNNIEKKDRRRDAAKQVGFGIINGITAPGLLNQMILYRAVRPDGTRWTLDDCDMMIREWFKIYRHAKIWQDACADEAMSTGVTREPIGGRVRLIPQIWASNRQVAEEARRISFSHRIQGSAQSYMKIAMKLIWDALRDAILREKIVRPVLQVHDELLKELRDDAGTRTLVDSTMIHYMENAVKLRVPVGADGKFGADWGSAH